MMKVCIECKNQYPRPLCYSDKQWQNRKYCSPWCARKNYTVIRLNQWQNPEYRKMMVDAHKGKPSPHLGKPNPKMCGEKNHRWKGGITGWQRKIRTSLEYKNWRRQVFERDKYTCQECGIKSGSGKAVILHADHIKPFAFYPKLRLELSNGRTLCIRCHKKTDTFAGRYKHED